MTYRGLYEFGKIELEKTEIREAVLDARLLLEFVCQTDRNTLLAHGEREITKEEENCYLKLIAKRAKHIPLQYLTRQQDFMGLCFTVDESTLIPRQDTEILVEEAMLQLHDGMEILDMCTGSGCILLSLLRYSNDCKGTGVDLNPEAISLAKKNAKDLELSATFYQSDLFENVQGKFDIIVSNPPYIPHDAITKLDAEVKEHEPIEALDGGEDGLDFYRLITKDAKKHLYKGGKLFFEIGYNQAQAVGEILNQNGYREIEVRKDLAGLERVVFATYTEV